MVRVAEREFIAPSALSRRMTELEEMLGTPLLARSKRGVSPTVAGETLLEYARSLLSGLNRLHAAVGEHAEGIRGHVRLLAIRAAVDDWLQNALSQFLADHPRVSITLEERVRSEVARGIATGAAEIGIGRDFGSPRELRVYPYGFHHLAVVVSRDHPLAESKSVNFIDTLAYNHIVCSSQGNSHMKFTEAAARDAGRAVNYRMLVSNPLVAMRFIADRHGVGSFPLVTLGRFAELYDLRTVALKDSWAQRMQYLCTSAIEPMSPAARRLMQHLLAHQHVAEPETWAA